MSGFLIENHFFQVPRDIYNESDSSTPILKTYRQKDRKTELINIDLAEINTIVFVVANNKGIPLDSDDPGNADARLLTPGTPLPGGLSIHQDHQGNLAIVPATLMPLSRFIGYLEELAMNCERVS